MTNFLNTYKTSENNSTHTRIPDKELNIYAGKFFVNDNNKFLEEYFSNIILSKKCEYLTEKQLDNGVIAIDLDFRYNHDVDNRQHDKCMIRDIVVVSIDLLKDFYNFTKETSFEVFVMEKPNVNRLADGSLTKDGIHIIIGLNMEKAIKVKYRNNLVKCLPEYVDLPLINSWESVVDKGVLECSTNWQLFGSRKPGNQDYQLTYHYVFRFDENDKELMMDEQLVGPMNFDLFKKLSVRNNDRPFVEPKMTSNIELFKPSMPTSVNSLKELNGPEDKYIELLFDVIGSDKKNITWDLWFQIAGVLKSNNYDKNIFLQYSKPNDISNEADKLWEGIKKNTMNIHTLQSIAKNINFFKYKEWLHKYEVNLYSPLFTSGLIADYFKLLYGDKFIRVEEKVYLFNGVYWETIDKKYTELINFIDKVFIKNLLEYATEQMTKFTAQLNGSEQDDITKTTITKITALFKNINSLRNSSVRKPIIEDITAFITNNNIEFDSNPYLFAFTNCVFDLKINKFVNPEPTFYITKTTGYSYDNNYSQNNLTKLNELIDTIFPDQEVKEYYLGILATGLCGLQIENCFIATGTGGNGKSLINSLMMKTCGQYAYKLPSDVLLSAIKTGPNPEVANMNNIRFVLTQEPNNKKKICCSTLKEITGDKTLNVRELYSSKCSIKLTNTTLIEANEIPAVDEVNDAVSRRIRTIPFLSRYVEQSVYDSLEDKTNVFVADSYYKTDEFQNKYKQALFDLLIIRFKLFVDNKHSLPAQPKCCLDKCSAFLGTCDDIYSWFESFYEKTDTIENSKAIPLANIYSSFSSSDFYTNLSKSDKRKYNKKYFISKIEENIFIRKFIKLRNSYHNNKQQSTDYLIGWQVIVSDELE